MDEESIERAANAIATLAKNSHELKELKERHSLLLLRYQNLVDKIIGNRYAEDFLLSESGLSMVLNEVDRLKALDAENSSIRGRYVNQANQLAEAITGDPMAPFERVLRQARTRSTDYGLRKLDALSIALIGEDYTGADKLLTKIAELKRAAEDASLWKHLSEKRDEALHQIHKIAEDTE